MWEFSCSLVWRGSGPRFGVVQRHSKAELTRVIVQCSGRGNLSHRGIPPSWGGGTGGRDRECWKVGGASTEQAQAGLSLRADSDFGTSRWLEARCGAGVTNGGSLLVLAIATCSGLGLCTGRKLSWCQGLLGITEIKSLPGAGARGQPGELEAVL